MRGTGSVIHHKPQKPICCDRPYKYSESKKKIKNKKNKILSIKSIRMIYAA
jgi:hypothetical protein